LWPLGGLAFVATPPRPGAVLWTTVAGPLVNVFLAPVLIGLMLSTAPAPDAASSDLHFLFQALTAFNIVMLVFNLLPIFPLDGGQILHSLLWFLVGRAPGLAIAAGIGLIAGAGLFVFAVLQEAWWFTLMTVFLMLGAIRGLRSARVLYQWDRLERRTDRICPNCRRAPPIGAFWVCGGCKGQTDAFESSGACSNCGIHIAEILCPDCGKTSVSREWITGESAPIEKEDWNTSEDNPQSEM
jgi:hypothetical protein